MPKSKLIAHTKKLRLILLSTLATFLLFIFLLITNFFISPKDKNLYLVTKVVDGDTIVVQDGDKETSIRLIGLDAPEIRGEECYYSESTEYLSKLVLNKKVRLEYDADTIDRFGRELAYVYIKPYGSGPDGAQTFANPDQEEMVNELLLRSGHARYSISEVNTKYSEQFLASSSLAQENSNGIWGNCGDKALETDAKCIIKGNVDKQGKKYYHLPGDKYYDETVINLDKEDQWLCTIEEAEAKNFTRANQ